MNKHQPIELDFIKFDKVNYIFWFKALLALVIIAESFLVSLNCCLDYMFFYTVLWLICLILFIVLDRFIPAKRELLKYYNIAFSIVALVVAVAYLVKYGFDITLDTKDWLLVELTISILIIMPFILILLPKALIVEFYHKVLKYRFLEVKNSDFFTNTLSYDLAIDNKEQDLKSYNTLFLISQKVNTKDIDIDELNSSNDMLNSLKQNYAKLIYFWYANRFERVFFRFMLPMWGMFFGLILFIVVLSLLDSISFENGVNVVRMAFAVFFLTILYMSVIYQVNTTLDAREYIFNINKAFKRLNINFPDIKLSQRVMLFLDKSFKIYIYDNKYDRRVALNKNRSFERFILKAELDKEGRDNIASIFVTVIIVVYIEIFAQVLATSKTDNTIDDINKTINKIELQLKQRGGEDGG